MEIEKIEQITDLFNDPNICELKMNNIHQSIAECRQISLPKEPLFEFEQPPPNFAVFSAKGSALLFLPLTRIYRFSI